jgi:hypothetical protein
LTGWPTEAILDLVPFAVELSFDEPAESTVRALWDQLERGGISSLGTVQGGPYRPHVSLAVFDDGDPDQLWGELARPVDTCLGMPLTLGALGFFLTDEAVAFLHVVPTTALLDHHRRVVSSYSAHPSRLWPYYGIDRFVPHCTLATGLRDTEISTVAGTLAHTRLPIAAHAAMGALVEVPSGRTLYSVS